MCVHGSNVYRPSTIRWSTYRPLVWRYSCSNMTLQGAISEARRTHVPVQLMHSVTTGDKPITSESVSYTTKRFDRLPDLKNYGLTIRSTYSGFHTHVSGSQVAIAT